MQTKEDLNSIKDAILPDIQLMIEGALKKIASEELAEKFLSVDEARKLFDPEVSRGTMYNWENAGYIQSYLIGGKRYFKYSELLEAVQRIKKYSRKPETA